MKIYDNLLNYFIKNKKVAIAFSGGTDSALLLYMAVKAGADVTAYYVKTAFQPQFEMDDARRLADELQAKLCILPVDIMNISNITDNPCNRCYYCKNEIFTAILRKAREDGYTLIADGTNASDMESDRPGMLALKELEIKSPLKECGLTKSDVREISKNVGLFTWNKPAYACLATRISTGEKITVEKLEATERAENYMATLGFSDFRVRRVGNIAKLQVRENQLVMLIEKRSEIICELKKYYDDVVLDLEVRA